MADNTRRSKQAASTGVPTPAQRMQGKRWQPRRIAGCGIAALVALAAGSTARAADAAVEVRKALEEWTADFNARRTDTVCDLFARELIAQYCGLPERGYDAQCGILQRSLADAQKTYRYGLNIKEIIVAGDIAAVRLTWTLAVAPADGAAQTTREEGIDIFRRQADGHWRIIRYIAYEEGPR
jgi:ketosteroid isomerase-like protein